MNIHSIKSLLLSATLSLTALATSAQESQPFVMFVNVPIVTRMIQINTEGVNLRRLPNTTSGKIMTWNSDGGSIDTYTKLFYNDTEASRYRANRNTGAYVEAYHPQNGEILMVNPDQSQPKNGWYQVLAQSEEYAGNSGNSNAKLGWVKQDFCKVIDIANSTPEELLSIKVPFTFSNPNNPEEEREADITLKGILQHRKTGMFDDFYFTLSAYNFDCVKIIYPQIEENLMYVCEADVPVEYDPNQTEAIKVEKIEEENDIGDIDEYVKITLKGNRNKDTMYKLYDALNNIPDSKFELIVNMIAPEGNLPSNRVFFRGTDGKAYEFSYNSGALIKDMVSQSYKSLQTKQ